MEPNYSNNTNIGMWEWCDEDFSLQRDPEFDIPHCIWDDIDQNDNNLLYALGEHTPTKGCTDFRYDVIDAGGKSIEGLEEGRNSSVKRRRMLQFTSDTDGTNTGNEHVFSASESSKAMEKSFMGDELLECLEWDPEWCSSFSDDKCDLSNENLVQSSEGPSANCFNQIQMHYTPPEISSSMNDSPAASDDQVEVLDLCKISSEMEKVAVQKNPSLASCRVFRGRKSYMKTPTKLTTTVAYPFTLIKPCSGQGDVTLKDINRRIHSPPVSRSHEDSRYPTSAYTGKPVVVKTRIRTEGGKGSITIMRTKG